MGTPNAPFITIAALSAVLNVLLGIYAGMKKADFSGIKYYVWITIASAVYVLGYSFELASGSLREIKFWIGVEYVGMPFIPPLCLILSCHYIGLGKLFNRRTVSLLLMIPALTLLAVSTNDFHHLFYRSVFLRAGTPSPMVDLQLGDWYIVHGVYTVACLLGSVFLLGRHWKKTKKTYRKQLLALIFSVLLPVLAAFLYLVGATPNGMDPVPPLTCLTSLAMAWSIFRNDMLTVVPVARDTIFDSMRDGVMVLDSADRLIDYNQAAAAILPSLALSSIGQSIDRIWKKEQGGDFPLPRDADGNERDERQIDWADANGRSHYSLRSSPVVRGKRRESARIIVMLNMTEQKRLQDRLQQLAYYDDLTRIYNRGHFIRLGKQLLERMRDAGIPISLVLFDIDHFKRINDTYGHETGDEALRHVVSSCRDKLGADDLFARYGGEEFVVCLPGASIGKAAATAERLRLAIAERPLESAHGPIAITASFGVAEASRVEDSLKQLLREADEALYSSKRDGRNRVSLPLTSAEQPSR
ncbi:histidine kinase N-terminal 7TM domain-containing protein [Cohnella zeiphila]|uniref:Diguanylate cyclase n=1 Tax=Cohnella zeiphila TaxID=2761120 RepID=A0A7X0SQ68_9BACL|nr:histidine kinase N-terminal 7TM domain-containing protein [Cohnella zeiphila]MBB6733034.1 diguanylate cyclase [Cohnella zeiphila]